MENCEFCNKTYVGRSAILNLKRHLIYCISNPESIRYKCDKCEREFEKRHALCAHKKFCGNLIEPKKTIKSNKTICDFCGYIAKNSLSLGGHISNCLLNPSYKNRVEKLKLIGLGKKHSKETKKKISDARKKYLSENPDKVPYKLNHSSKESYPEKYFTEVFKNEGIDVVKSFYIGLYELDFCIPDKKIDIEIDGSQHYYDNKIVESDKRRNRFLEGNGWDIIRVNWSDYQKLNFDEKKEYITNLKNYINNLIEVKPSFIKETKERKQRNKKEYLCKQCGVKCTWSKDRCESCYRLDSRKVERPSLEQLEKDIKSLGYSGTGRKYGVSDNSIRKWIKNKL